MKTLFVPIKSQNLAFYYSRGLILPANNIENRTEDIQNQFLNGILLTEIKWTDETDCCLEIVLDNFNPNKISQNFYIINKPIPISRICSIYFKNKKQKETTLWNINNSTAFIPENIVKIETNPVEKIILKNEFENIQEVKFVSTEYNEKIKEFDKILGGLAFMKFGGSSSMNYSQNYFVVLSDLNKIFENEIFRTNTSFNLKLKGILTNESVWTVLLQHLQNEITKDYVKKLAEEKNVKLEQNYILEFNKLDLTNSEARIIYYLSIIATYGTGKQNKIEDLVYDLSINKIEHNKEIVSLLFGMYEGYKILRHSINNMNIKFELNSKLDFYTIESVYQFVFNKIKDNSKFEYIDNWCPKFINNINEDDFETYQVLDKKIILKKKIRPESPEFLEQFYQKSISQFLEEINNSEISKIIDIKELFEKIKLKKFLAKFQQALVSNMNAKLDNKIKNSKNERQVQQKTIEITEKKQMQKNYTETELKNFSITQLEETLNSLNIPFKKNTKKVPYINLIINKQKSETTLFNR